MNQAASNVTLKHPTGPWWTIYGTAGEIVQQIGQVFPHLTQGAQATDFPVIVAQASAEWAQLVGATSQTPAQQPQQTFGQPAASPHAQAVNTVQNAVQGTVQPGGNIEVHPKGWGTFEHNHPQAPQTIYGPKVLKRAKSQAGKDYAQWLDPRDPGIPSVYAANGKAKPQDLLPAEFANGV